MKNSNYLDALVREGFIKNYMATLRKLLIVRLNIITVLTNRRGVGKSMEHIIKLFNINISLRTVPVFFSESGYLFQISFSALR